MTPVPARSRGFTLIELLVVLGIIALLLTLAVTRFFPSIDKSKETMLAENLRNTRDIIGQYYSDTGRYPDSLEQLVEKKYLARLPVDPILESEAILIRRTGTAPPLGLDLLERLAAPGTDVDAPDGTAARAVLPSSRPTSTSTVGLPRESRISLATMASMVPMWQHSPFGFRPVRA